LLCGEIGAGGWGRLSLLFEGTFIIRLIDTCPAREDEPFFGPSFWEIEAA